MDVLIFSGQSNMQGQTESLPLPKEIKDAYEYRLEKNEIIPLKHPVGETFGELLLSAHEGHGSLLPDFCESYVEKTKKPVLAVHVAKGATTIGQWLPETERYGMLIKKCKGALSTLSQAEKIEKIYFIWLQGESDAIENTGKELYKQRIKVFKDSLVNDLKIDGFFFIRVGKFVRDNRDIEIISAQEELCQGEEFTMLTRITGVLTENERFINPFAAGHYNNTAMSIIGKIAGENLANYRLGGRIILEQEPYPEMKK